ADGCFPFSAARLELGENDVETLNGELCPTDQAMLTLAAGWRFQAEARALEARAPFLSMNAHEGRGLVDASDTGSGLIMDLEVRDVRIDDAETPLRFFPVRAEGRVGLAGGDWTGTL